MTDETQWGKRRGIPWRMLGWGTAAFLLLLPLIAMQFTREVNWDETDFIVMGVLFGTVGLGIEFLVRKSSSIAYRVASVLAVLSAFLIVWANLAVGMIGSEDNPYNLLFLGIIPAAAIGAAIARFRPGGMAIVMLAAALAQGLIALGGMSYDMRGGIFSLVIATPWLLAGALFGIAGRTPARRSTAA